MKKILVLFLTLFLIFGFNSTASALEIGTKAENFKLADLEGKIVSLSDFKGKIVILNFWATWCPPCKEEMPDFDSMDRELKKSKEAVLLAINMTDGKRDTKEKVVDFINKNKYGMQVLLDTEGKAAGIFNIRWLPTTAVIDSNGILRGQILGGATKEAVMKIVKGIK